ncbi:MAG: orotate phosphoribosyltransferase [Candidatus Thermoplasmatota archaeon]|nr:orotate phosphoribosyltransferase [Candidatus Thermoplasmatota archaeon]
MCMMCGRPGAMYTCHLCGRLVCERCYDHHHGVCRECQHQNTRFNVPKNPID